MRKYVIGAVLLAVPMLASSSGAALLLGIFIRRADL
jgi:hypothetical protein